MADTTQESVARRSRTRPGARAGAPRQAKTAAEATPAKAPVTSAPEPVAKPKFGFFRGLGGRKATTDAPAQTATKAGTQTSSKAGTTGTPAQRPPQPQFRRFFFGMTLYLALAFAAQIGLNYLFANIPGHGQQVLITLPLIGPITVALAVWMLVLITILWALYRFNVLPRNLAGQTRQSAASAKADPKASKPAPAKPAREPLSGPNDDVYARVKARIRAQRRKLRRR